MCRVCGSTSPLHDVWCEILGLPTGKYWISKCSVTGHAVNRISSVVMDVISLARLIITYRGGKCTREYFWSGIDRILRLPAIVQLDGVSPSWYSTVIRLALASDLSAEWLDSEYHEPHFNDHSWRVPDRFHETLTPAGTLFGEPMYMGVKECHSLDALSHPEMVDLRFYRPSLVKI